MRKSLKLHKIIKWGPVKIIKRLYEKIWLLYNNFTKFIKPYINLNLMGHHAHNSKLITLIQIQN